MRWHPQPQKNRPKTAVTRIAATKKTRPVLTIPCLANSMPSDGSTGLSVTPRSIHWAKWAIMKRLTPMSAIVRHNDGLVGRRPRGWITGRVTGSDPGPRVFDLRFATWVRYQRPPMTYPHRLLAGGTPAPQWRQLTKKEHGQDASRSAMGGVPGHFTRRKHPFRVLSRETRTEAHPRI